VRIPEIQSRLLEIAAETRNGEIAKLARALSRRSPRRKAPAESQPMTPEIAAQIRTFEAANPNLSQVAIAKRFNVNPGRVSEAIRGRRN